MIRFILSFELGSSMVRMRREWGVVAAPMMAAILAMTNVAVADDAETVSGVLPKDAQGAPLNLDFETGDLRDWHAEGQAFDGQPIEGDTVAARRSDMKSRHVGRFWVGTYEVHGDEPRGTLTSRPFVVSHPWARFLISGGSHPTTRVELVRRDTDRVIFRASGDDTEDLKPVTVDLSDHMGQEIFIRLVDDHAGGWGHINFDDFKFFATEPQVPPRTVPVDDVYEHAGLDPETAAEAMTVPEGFSVSLMAGEPDVVRPIALALDDRGRLWVAENHAYPIKVPEDQARDRILIFEDTTGDGHLDSRKVFYEGLNMVTGLEVGFGGVWVGAAPELLFIPDEDGDDVPDGPPQVLLDGWGLQDTHETLNAFIWGPDGWLYGCHGVFTHSNVGKPGTPDEDRVPINAGIWRYHPTKHLFEVFAHGTSNPWGVDFDDRGQGFLTACVIPHLYHVIQGARYQRQAGGHFNPHTYDDIKHIGDHVHWVGDNPHRGNNRSDAAGGGHAHSGAMIYLGGTWPEEYHGSIFMNNIHGARINRDILEPKGSGFVGRHAPDFLLANDRASQILNLRYGPDGHVYMIDWYDLNQCHRTDPDVHDQTTGRIFKIRYGHGKPKPVEVDLKTWDNQRLIGLLFIPVVREGREITYGHPNDWHLRHAQRILQERGLDPESRQQLAHLAFDGSIVHHYMGVSLGRATTHHLSIDEPKRLRALWMLHSTGGLDEEHVARGLADESPYIRAWTIQLAMEDKAPSSATLAKFVAMAESDPSPVVRLYLASALQRLPLEQRWDILERLVAHAEDADDHNLPLMYWYAAEPLAEADPVRAARLAAESPIGLISTFMTRRIAAIGTTETLATLVDELGRTRRPAQRLALLVGIAQALEGRRQVEMPDDWPEVYRTLLEDNDPQVRAQATTLALTFGDPSALAALREILSDTGTELSRRQEALAALLRVRAPDLVPTLHELTRRDSALRRPALRGLAASDDPTTPQVILEIYLSLNHSEKRDALNTLAARLDSARVLLAAVADGTVPASDLSADLVRQLRNHDDEALNAQIEQVWGLVRDTTEDKAALIARYKAMLSSEPEQTPDLALGRSVYEQTCAQCHKLFGEGGDVGPELTGSNRADLDYVLSNVLDPSAEIGRDYLAHVVATSDGRVLTGIIRSEDDNAITLVTANETITLPRDEIEERKVSEQSMMPDDLWANLSEHEIRSLVAYLAGPEQVPMPEEATTATSARRPQTDAELRFWLETMVWHHRFTSEEITAATGLNREEIAEALERFDIRPETKPERPDGAPLLVLPYPGGRHPRIGFRDGAIDPQRETKVSVFTPWDDASYVVVDVPEAIWSNLGLTYLAHTHVPTLWTERGIVLEPREWTRHADGSLTSERTLPNGIAFGTKVVPRPDAVLMEMWLTNGTDQTLSDLRVQNCVMLKGAKGFQAQTNDNKVIADPYVACRSDDGRRWVITAWEPCHRPWANPPCPCLHSDPKFPDCPPGETKRLRGWLSFYEGPDIVAELRRIDQTGWREQ